MPNAKPSLTVLDQSVIKQKLLADIDKIKKRVILQEEKKEQLIMELLVIKHEYDKRITMLYLKINDLEIDILKKRQLHSLMDEGLDKEAAEAIVNETFQPPPPPAYTDEYKEDEETVEKHKNIPQNTQADLKALWRKLVAKYHPDLVQDPATKLKYEAIMKKINLAYRQGDLETLLTIDATPTSNGLMENTVDALRAQFSNLQKALRILQKEIKNLKNSEWYEWKMNIEIAKEEGRDLLGDLEAKLKNDIREKEQELKDLSA